MSQLVTRVRAQQNKRSMSEQITNLISLHTTQGWVCLNSSSRNCGRGFYFGSKPSKNMEPPGRETDS